MDRFLKTAALLMAQQGLHSTLADEIRISKGLGPKGYAKVRMSSITREPHPPRSDFNFTYSARFKRRWTQYYLHSALLDLRPGSHRMRLGDDIIKLKVPAPSDGVQGVLIADACFSSEAVTCEYGDRWDILNRSTLLLNKAFSTPSGSEKLDFFALLGDNFYDSSGELSQEFFSRLTADVKGSFMMVVNGNHDIWGCGNPLCGVPHDQQGWGQMQYFPMDTVASTSIAGGNDAAGFIAFDFEPDIPTFFFALLRIPQWASICIALLCSLYFLGTRCPQCMGKQSSHQMGPMRTDDVPFSSLQADEDAEESTILTSASAKRREPFCTTRYLVIAFFLLLAFIVLGSLEAAQPWHRFENDPNNFLWYHRLGNIGFVGYSGAADWASTQPHLENACEFFGHQTGLQAIILLGHWDIPGMGCSVDMATPAVREAMSRMPGCQKFGERLKYINGHEHCNFIQERSPTGEPRGFRIGGHGMTGDMCPKGEYGFMLFDSRRGRVRMYYFEIASGANGDRFEQLLDCVSRHGLRGCTHMADHWLDIRHWSSSNSGAAKSVENV